jgi:uncharacterized secreted repeat protein (TIGR03808 family)
MNRRQVVPAGMAAAGGLMFPEAAAFAKTLKANSKSDQSAVLAEATAAAGREGGVVQLPAGRFIASGVQINETLVIAGVPGRTQLVSADGAPVFSIKGGRDVVLQGLDFETATNQDAAGRSALVVAQSSEALTIRDCRFSGGAGGLVLEGCSGRVSDCRFSGHAATGLFANDSRGLLISGNTVADCGNNGIQVWRPAAGEDGTIVSHNRIARIAANDGGSGQNGNGINVFRAANVVVSNNRISDCAYSAIRNNAGSNCQISGNTISRTGEVAIYVEFGFEGCVVSGNVIEDVGFGISVTNFNEGGRLAVIANNLVRNCRGGTTAGVTAGGGIFAEADTAITGNTIEQAKDFGIGLGWGLHCRDLAVTGNTVRACGRGVTVSLSDGALPVLIANNLIAESREAAIMGMDYGRPVTADVAKPGADIPANIQMSGNLIR